MRRIKNRGQEWKRFKKNKHVPIASSNNNGKKEFFLGTSCFEISEDELMEISIVDKDGNNIYGINEFDKIPKERNFQESFSTDDFSNEEYYGRETLMEFKENKQDSEIFNSFSQALENDVIEISDTDEDETDSILSINEIDIWKNFTKSSIQNFASCNQCGQLSSTERSVLEDHLKAHNSNLKEHTNQGNLSCCAAQPELDTSSAHEKESATHQNGKIFNMWNYFKSIKTSANFIMCLYCKKVLRPYSSIGYVLNHMLCYHPNIINKELDPKELRWTTDFNSSNDSIRLEESNPQRDVSEVLSDTEPDIESSVSNTEPDIEISISNTEPVIESSISNTEPVIEISISNTEPDIDSSVSNTEPDVERSVSNIGSDIESEIPQHVICGKALSGCSETSFQNHLVEYHRHVLESPIEDVAEYDVKDEFLDIGEPQLTECYYTTDYNIKEEIWSNNDNDLEDCSSNFSIL